MSETREFPIADVLGYTTGRLLGPIEGLYQLGSFMVGRPVFTHELPETFRLAAPDLLEQFPELAAADGETVTTENCHDKLAEWTNLFGPTRTVKPLGWNRLAEQSPMDTAAELFGTENVIVVTPESP